MKKERIQKKCWNCGKIFEVSPSTSHRKFCPNSNCYNEFKQTKKYQEYVLEKIKIGNNLWKKKN